MVRLYDVETMKNNGMNERGSGRKKEVSFKVLHNYDGSYVLHLHIISW